MASRIYLGKDFRKIIYKKQPQGSLFILATGVGLVPRSLGAGQSIQDALTSNLAYACALARIKYYRDPLAIPADLYGQAETWKRVYNTAAGKGTIDEYMTNRARYAK